MLDGYISAIIITNFNDASHRFHSDYMEYYYRGCENKVDVQMKKLFINYQKKKNDSAYIYI